MKVLVCMLSVALFVLALYGTAYAGARVLVTPVLAGTATEDVVCVVVNGNNKTITATIELMDPATGVSDNIPTPGPVLPGRSGSITAGFVGNFQRYCRFTIVGKKKGVTGAIKIRDGSTTVDLVVVPAQ